MKKSRTVPSSRRGRATAPVGFNHSLRPPVFGSQATGVGGAQLLAVLPYSIRFPADLPQN